MPDGALQAKVLTVSDGVADGTRDDASGRALVEQLTAPASRSSITASPPTAGTTWPPP